MKDRGRTMDDLSRFCCQNPQCADYGKRGAGNLTACMRFGKGKRLRLLYCRTCHARFSERKGTPLFEARLPEATVYSEALRKLILTEGMVKGRRKSEKT